MNSRVLGLDLSLTSTGVASDLGWTDRIRPGDLRGLERLRYITRTIGDYARTGRYRLAVLEGPSYGSRYGSPHERGGLWWMVYDLLDRHEIPVAVAPPTCLKLWATGSGAASKTAVLDSMLRRYPHAEITTSDEADALALAEMGAAWRQAWCLTNAAQRRALDGVAWPEVTYR